MLNKIKFALAVASISLISACGGGGGKPDANQGKFVDSAVTGLSYVCGSFRGITTVDGIFDYEPGNICAFNIGGINIGSAPAAPIVTLINLVEGAIDSSNPIVVRIAQLLQSLDFDNNPDNGIEITNASKTTLANATINFSSENFISEATSVVGSVYQNRQLVSEEMAKNHLNTSLLGLLAGNYQCTYTGDSNSGSGTAKLTVLNGQITGIFNSLSGRWGILSGEVAPSGDAVISNVSGVSSCSGDAATFTGSFKNNGNGSGSWSSPPSYGGTWSCTKGGSGYVGDGGCSGAGGGAGSPPTTPQLP